MTALIGREGTVLRGRYGVGWMIVAWITVSIAIAHCDCFGLLAGRACLLIEKRPAAALGRGGPKFTHRREYSGPVVLNGSDSSRFQAQRRSAQLSGFVVGLGDVLFQPLTRGFRRSISLSQTSPWRAAFRLRRADG